MEKNYQQQFYYSQNIEIRKQIRQYDLRLAQGQLVKGSCNFLVVGPPKVGKTSLLKTLQFALNGSQGWGIVRKNHHATVEIKKGATYQVEGMKKLREIGQKFGIQGIELLSDNKPSSRYKQALQFVDGSLGACIVDSHEVDLRSKAKVCLIVLNLTMDIAPDEMAYLKYLKTDLSDRGVAVLLVLTGSFRPEGSQWTKMQTRITALHHQFDIKRDDIICMETYTFVDPIFNSGKLILKQSSLASTKIESSEEINFYGLQLLQKILSESQRNKPKQMKLKGWLCNWA